MKMPQATSKQNRLERTFEALDEMGAIIWRNYRDGNKSDARNLFRACPAERRGYLAYTIIGLHMTCGANSHVVDLDAFFKSVTD